jgi:hypothetical protein
VRLLAQRALLCRASLSTLTDAQRGGYVRAMADSELQQLIERARSVTMTPAQKEEQRRSFAFGNTKIENERITRQIIDDAAEALKAR